MLRLLQHAVHRLRRPRPGTSVSSNCSLEVSLITYSEQPLWPVRQRLHSSSTAVAHGMHIRSQRNHIKCN